MTRLDLDRTSAKEGRTCRSDTAYLHRTIGGEGIDLSAHLEGRIYFTGVLLQAMRWSSRLFCSEVVSRSKGISVARSWALRWSK